MDDYFRDISLDIQDQECMTALYSIENEMFNLSEALMDLSKQTISKSIGESGYALAQQLEEWSCEAELLAKYAYDTAGLIQQQLDDEETHGSYEDQVRSQYYGGQL